MFKWLVDIIMKVKHNGNVPNNGSFKQGNFIPKNVDKCLNYKMGKPIYYRSSYEERMFNWCDMNKNIVKWGSELIEIPYVYDYDPDKLHRYYPDVYIELIDTNGNLKKYLIEVKPKKQTEKPIKPKRKTNKAIMNYNNRVKEYIKNLNKWKYASIFCEGKNWEFKLVTENDLF